MDDIPSRVAVLEQIARDTAQVLGRIEKRLDRIDDRLMAMDAKWDTKLDRLTSRIGRLEISAAVSWLALLGLYGVGGWSVSLLLKIAAKAGALG